jgi:hypothetical protein
MPTLKKQSRTIGKLIRKATGLPLPVCMRAGHKVVRGEGLEVKNASWASEHVKEEIRRCGDGCCVEWDVFLVGPKGMFKVS